MALDSIQSLLEMLKSRFPKSHESIEAAKLLQTWPAIVGPGIAKHTKALRLIDQKLYVAVDHPAWKSELHHRKRAILEKLNQNQPDHLKVLEIIWTDLRGAQ